MNVTRADLIALVLTIVLCVAVMFATTAVIDARGPELSAAAQTFIDWLP